MIPEPRPSPLADPEADWEWSLASRTIERSEVERRIGPTQVPLEVLPGRTNLNVRVGADRVLRIYLRDQTAVGRELALLSRPWTSFRVPRVLASGDDFLLLERVPHRHFEDSPEHGTAAGRALAEIHQTRYPVAGHFGPELSVAHPLADFPLALGEHVDERLSKVSGGEVAELRRSARRLFEANLDRLRTAAGGPVLMHGDFKPSNLHWSSSGELLVLDWEFTFAGPPLMDFGQLTRWLPSASFTNAVASAYRSHGGSLVDDWMRWCQLLDLGNLAGLLAAAAPDSRRFTDLMRRIGDTLSRLQ